MFAQDACEALSQNTCIRVTVRDEPYLLEVHAVGKTSDGDDHMRVWQVAETNSASSGWRLIRLNEVSAFSHTSLRSLAPRLGYRSSDPDLTEIYCKF